MKISDTEIEPSPSGASTHQSTAHSPDKRPFVTWKQTILSGLSAAAGIQSAAARERDFTKGSFVRFLVVGVVLTGLFVGTLLLIIGLLVP